MARRRLLFSYFYLTYNGSKYGETVNISSFSEDGGTDSFSVTSSKEWSVVSKPAWITMSVSSGGKGETAVTLTASANEGTSEKTGSIVIKTIDDRYTATLYVTQDGIVPYIRINNSDADVNENVTFRNTISSYTIKSRGGWTLAVTGGTTNITAITDTNVVETALTITYPKNTDTGSSKTIKVVLTNTSDNTIKKTITLTQAAESYITFTRSGADANVIPYNGEVGSILVNTNITGFAYEESSQLELSKTLGLINNETITYTAQTITTANTATTVSISVTAKTTDYDSSDGIAQNVYTYNYELYPYLNMANANVSSASTTGSTTYSSNYNVVNVTPASQGITNIVLNNGNLTFTLPEPSWNNETYTLTLSTTGTVGPAITKQATITRPAKVAYLNTTNIDVPKEAGNPTSEIIGAIDTNDTYTLSVTSGSNWLTYNQSTGTFSMTENTGTDDRTATVTVTTTHNGANGTPVTKTITVTQKAIPTVDQNITVNLDMKQNSGGTWYIKTSTSNSSLNFPITISYGGNQFNTTVNSGNYVQTPFTTAVGTQIVTANISGTPSYLDTDAHVQYYITYVMPTNVAYTETVQSLVPTSVNLTYSDTDFLANGSASTTSQYSTPSSFVINYNEIIGNSFDDTTRTVPKTESGLNHITSLVATTSNGGSVNSTYNIGASNRGTTTGNSQTVVVIDKVNYTFSGQSYTYDIPNITFTQGENKVTNVDTTQRTTYQDKGSSVTVTGVTLTSTENKFLANGKTPNNNNTISVSATETGTKTYTSGVTVYTDSAVTYTSGAHQNITDTTGTAGTDVTRTEAYSNSVPVYEHAKTGTSLNYSSSNVSASNLGTTETPQGSIQLRASASTSSSIYGTLTITQDANEITNVDTTQRTTYQDKGSTTTITAVTITTSENSFNANGKTPNNNNNITASATETGTKTFVSGVTVFTDSAVTYTSGGIKNVTDTTGVVGTDVTRTETYSATVPVTQDSKTGTSITYNSSTQTLTATNLGTTETDADDNQIVLKAVASSGSLNATKTIAQQANTKGSPVYGGATSARTAGASTTHYTNIGFTVERNDKGLGFDASGMVNNQTFDYITVDVTETGNTYDTTVYNYTGTSAYTVTYTSGEISAYTQTSTWSKTESGATSSYNNRATYVSKSGTWLTVTTRNSKQDVSADNRGTTTGATRTGTLTYRSTHDSSKTTTVSIRQDANTRTTATRTEYTAKPTAYSGVTVSISASETRFYANGVTPNNNTTVTITASESYSYADVSGVTNYTDTIYSSGVIVCGTTGTAGADIYGTWRRTTGTPELSVTGGEGNSLDFNSSTKKVTAENLSATTASTGSIEITATSTHDTSKTNSVRITQDANNRVADSCTINVNPSALEFKKTERSKTVSVTSTTEYVYDSGARSTSYTIPNSTITGSQSSQFNIVAPSVPRNPLVYTINCPSYTAEGRGLPIASAVFTSSDCSNVSREVDLSFSGDSTVVLPTFNGSFGNAGNYWYISLDSFDILNATPNVTWTSNVAYNTTIEGEHYSGQFTFTAKTSSYNEIQYLGMSGDSHMSYSNESGASTVIFRHDAAISTTTVPTGRLDVGQPQQA